MKQHDRNYLSVIYTDILADLYVHGRWFTHDGELVKDCIQDVFLQLCVMENITAIRNLPSYVRKMFKNRLLKELNRKINEEFIETSNDDQAEISVEEQFIAAEEYQQITIKLENALNALTDSQKMAIRFYFTEQRSYHEICRLLGINYQSAKNLVHEALIRLRKFIDAIPNRYDNIG